MKIKKFTKKIILTIEKTDDFKFSRNTTYGLGGRARIAYFPKNAVEAICVFEKILKSGESYFVLGNGSNVLASDRDFNGAVICTKNLKGIYKVTRQNLYCLSGTLVSELERFCLNNGLGGVEYLNQIPATVGGVAYMNGGAGGIYFNSNVFGVVLYDGKLKKFNNYACHYAYKQSTMRNIKCLILGIFIKLSSTSSDIIKDNLVKFSQLRKKLPKGKSCGCVFKNPPETSAGLLIEEAGLKGLRVGNAEVSADHANFIINRGGSSSDVYELIQTVKSAVYDRFSVLLEEEVILLGDFGER